jgi:integrase
MSVRNRVWVTRQGERREAWIVDYTDQQGARHIHTFARKKDADDHAVTVGIAVRQGVHTAPSRSIAVAQAAADWLAYVEGERRERSTLAQYRQHVNRHIVPRIGRERLAKLTLPRLNAFRDDLLASMSRAMARKVLTSLKSILRDAQRRGNVAQNLARDVSIGVSKRDKRRPEAGVDIPTPEEITRIINAVTGRLRPLVLTAIFAGLRASELRGLRWEDVDLKRGKLHVKQRADRYNSIGEPKSHSSKRTIPIGPLLLNALKQWRLACPIGELVLPTAKGQVEDHKSIVRALAPMMVAAGVVTKDGKPKYTGLHSFRHFYASWCINRKEEGGLELPAKVVQHCLGHSSIVMTLDRYGHLFPSKDDGSELAEAERALWG